MPGNGVNKALLEDAKLLIYEMRQKQAALRKLAKELGEANKEELVKSGVKRFRLGNTVLVLEYRPSARSPERRWNLTEEDINETVS